MRAEVIGDELHVIIPLREIAVHKTSEYAQQLAAMFGEVGPPQLKVGKGHPAFKEGGDDE